MMNRTCYAANGSIALWLLTALLPAACQGQVTNSLRPVAETRVPNFSGATGLVRAPDAYIQRNGQAVAFIAGDAHNLTGGALVGIANRLEISAALRDSESARAASLVNAKIALVKEQLLTPAISVGIVDASSRERSAYFAVSKSVIPYFTEAVTGQRFAVKMHFGFGGGDFHNRLYAGAEVTGSGNLSGIAEVVSGHVDLGGRYCRDGFTATIAWLNLNEAGGSISYALLR